jgi:glycosyltransferase involved in cell wall biosynthesis
LFIVGTGPYLHDLKEMAIKLNILGKVIFTGGVSDENLLKYYNLADIFAFPTLRMEGLPLVLPEAMACEKPVIASRIGGITTVIDNNKDGILIETGNLKELKGKVLEVLGNEELARKLGKNARKKVVERFGLDRMIKDTIKIYEEVLRK